MVMVQMPQNVAKVGPLKEETNLTKAFQWTSKKIYLVACLDHTGATETT